MILQLFTDTECPAVELHVPQLAAAPLLEDVPRRYGLALGLVRLYGARGAVWAPDGPLPCLGAATREAP